MTAQEKSDMRTLAAFMRAHQTDWQRALCLSQSGGGIGRLRKQRWDYLERLAYRIARKENKDGHALMSHDGK